MQTDLELSSEMVPSNLIESNIVDKFLQTATESLFHIEEFEVITVILGNESCDLDSVCCSIAYGVYFYDQYMRNSLDNRRVAIALLDIPREEMPCKTEVLYWMKRLKVRDSFFVFRDQIDLFDIYTKGKLNLVLVDHHVLAPRFKGLEPAVKEIIDHRPTNTGINWINVDVDIKVCGSCATLITQKLIKLRRQLFSLQFALLLYGPIILDTAGLSPTSGRTTDLDKNMATALETLFPDCKREPILNDLVQARADISSLTTDLLLRKDLKFAARVPIVGLPISVPKLLERTDLEAALMGFCDRTSSHLMVIMGQELESGQFSRSLGIYVVEGYVEHALKFIEILQESSEPDLQMEEISEESLKIARFFVFTQGNDKASRKQVLPLVLDAVRNEPFLKILTDDCIC